MISLPEVVVGARVVVVVVVVVGAEDGDEAGGEGEVHKGNQTQTQNHHLHWRRRRRKGGEKWTLHHHPGPGPDHQSDHQLDHQGHGARSEVWPRSGSGPRLWPSKGMFVLQIDFATVTIINYYCPCYILTYVDFGTIMLSIQISIWTAKSSRQNVSDFLHNFITFY